MKAFYFSKEGEETIWVPYVLSLIRALDGSAKVDTNPNHLEEVVINIRTNRADIRDKIQDGRMKIIDLSDSEISRIREYDGQSDYVKSCELGELVVSIRANHVEKKS